MELAIQNPTSPFSELPAPGSQFFSVSGLKNYELTNHLGNVLSVVSDDAPISQQADLVCSNDYFPFGSQILERSYSSGVYRFGFNTQERTDEIAGVGNHNTALFWEYDPRLGRRWNIDPVIKPWESPYATFANSPILYSDPNGLDAKNGHEQEVKDRTDDVAKAKSGLADVKSKESSIDKNDKKAMKAFKQEVEAAETELKRAESSLTLAQEKFDMVEKLLTEYAFYDPEGYEYVDDLKDPDNQTVDVYFAVDESLIGHTGGFDEFGRSITSGGQHGKTDIAATVIRTDGVITDIIVRSQKYGDNTVYVPLLRKTDDATIAHEKHHIYIFVMSLPAQGPEDLDEGGAKKEERRYLKSKIGKGSVPPDFKRK